MKAGANVPPDPSDYTSRRRAIRFQAPPDMSVTFSDPKIRSVVVDVSFGGLGLITNVPPRRGEIYDIVLRHGTAVASCAAKAAHVRRGQEGGWLVGMSFIHDGRLALVERFVDHLTGGLIQFS